MNFAFHSIMENSYHENKNAMYQFPTQHHYPHHLYPQCPPTLDHSKLQNLNSAGPDKFAAFLPQNVLLEDQLQLNEPVRNLEAEQSEGKTEKKKRTRKPKAEKSKSDESKKKSDKSVDTSTFTIEERLVSAVWIHERHETHHTITEIKDKFQKRFNREPPSKTTLFAWERKLFATGNVCDAPRPGRPEKRKSAVSEVAASLASAPALSLRARAAALRLPRTTLHNIMKKDLPPGLKDKGRPSDLDKPPPKRRVKQPPRKNQPGCPDAGLPELPPPPPPPAPAPPPPPAAPTHMHYMMHAMHSHAHTHPYT